jgi:hypothetical protein
MERFRASKGESLICDDRICGVRNIEGFRHIKSKARCDKTSHPIDLRCFQVLSCKWQIGTRGLSTGSATERAANTASEGRIALTSADSCGLPISSGIRAGRLAMGSRPEPLVVQHQVQLHYLECNSPMYAMPIRNSPAKGVEWRTTP